MADGVAVDEVMAWLSGWGSVSDSVNELGRFAISIYGHDVCRGSGKWQLSSIRKGRRVKHFEWWRWKWNINKITKTLPNYRKARENKWKFFFPQHFLLRIPFFSDFWKSTVFYSIKVHSIQMGGCFYMLWLRHIVISCEKVVKLPTYEFQKKFKVLWTLSWHCGQGESFQEELIRKIKELCVMPKAS